VRTPPSLYSYGSGLFLHPTLNAELSPPYTDISAKRSDSSRYYEDGFLISSSSAQLVQNDDIYTLNKKSRQLYHDRAYQETTIPILHLDKVCSTLSKFQIHYSLSTIEDQIKRPWTSPGFPSSIRGLHKSFRVHRPVPRRPFLTEKFTAGCTRIHKLIKDNTIIFRVEAPKPVLETRTRQWYSDHKEYGPLRPPLLTTTF
jgi:hypothetical protein